MIDTIFKRVFKGVSEKKGLPVKSCPEKDEVSQHDEP